MTKLLFFLSSVTLYIVILILPPPEPLTISYVITLALGCGFMIMGFTWGWFDYLKYYYREEKK